MADNDAQALLEDLLSARLSPAIAAANRERAELMVLLHKEVRSWDCSPGIAAARLGVRPQRLTELLRLRIRRFSLASLRAMAKRLEPRSAVMQAYLGSHERFDSFYRKLACG